MVSLHFLFEFVSKFVCKTLLQNNISIHALCLFKIS